MTADGKKKVAKVLALTVSFGGILVMLGWIFSINVLTSLSSSWVSMKFDTAIAFVVSGVILYAIAQADEGDFDKAQVTLSIATMILVLIMGTLFVSSVFGISTGIEDIFVQETVVTSQTVFPGRPSMPTMINFILIVLASILTMLRRERLKSELKMLGLIILGLGVIAVAGYMFHAPLLYYFIEGINTAMAFPTAVLFALLGIGLVCLSD